ncbi:hypothetical protein Tco_0048664 [Tanacetum coccineum]
MVIAIARTRLGFTRSFLLNASVTTFALTGWSRSISAGAFSTLDVALEVANILSLTLDWIVIDIALTCTSQFFIASLLVNLAYNFSFLTLEVVQTILAFPRVLDDMETSRLESLQELNLCRIQLVVAVVIDKSFGTYQQNLIRRKYHSLLVYLPACSIRFSQLLEYVYLKPEVSHHLPTIS